MSRRPQLASSLILAAAATFLCAASTFAQTAPIDITASPEIYKIAAQNDDVMLVEARWAPGQRDQMHSHPAQLYYFLTPCALRFTNAEGKTSDSTVDTGRAGSMPPIVAHAVQNIGKAECRVLIVEARPR